MVGMEAWETSPGGIVFGEVDDGMVREALGVEGPGKWPVKHYYVTMNDGVKLFVSVFVLEGKEQQPSPAVVDRSPYGPLLEELADLWLPVGYAAVMVNQRGTGLSEGNWTMWHTSASDGATIMQWITEQAWSNGIVFEEGASADGIEAYTSFLVPQPHVKAAWVLWSTGRSHPLVYQNGAFRHSLVGGWIESIHAQRPWMPAYLPEMYEHEAFDTWWAEISFENYTNVDVPMIHYAGWGDIFLQHQLETFAAFQAQGAAGARGKQKLVVGPLGHCSLQAHDRRPQAELAEIFSYDLATWLFVTTAGEPFDPPKLDTITFYVMGANESHAPGSYWTTLPEWPATTPKTFYLAANKVLAVEPSSAGANETYVFDPANPVKTIGGNNLMLPCGQRAQNAVEGRADVLVFTSAKLSAPVAIAGRMSTTLYVSSSRNDTDFTVKVTDVFPDGASILITDDIIRMRWRVSDKAPVGMVPGTVYKVTIELWATSYVFNTGHALRFAVSSSNYPRFSVNPNTGLPIIDFDEAHMLVAHNTLHFGGETPSSLTLPVVSMTDIPHNVL
ncbi:X-Pro dipeptidyl-peptidase domain-containing protein [Thecamonas trahens ATCC 50062]|uniref:X-Pro dipeptidyl-peptidase domain-containing protein n=1 Tax=Thecamonas trahens ATCC 50062 TaxID=461836 RepID=A0A0L0D7G2_THETB|nr:X-Pro dipeptidyl-peptidase domain-containing protein [Thecamonas trahens ATCC 50062]KNC47238.1 X-Pro dipeptidyl-peptidase domain-containing protein [Thecamonas trahens ATCC 50062]|eukprot:XP_013759581.1 X-Pro dipeptidyl-peptidase domain-containing protein [Thecamonas trahens ATCC 50062]